MPPLDVRLLVIAGPPQVPVDALPGACAAAVDGGATAVQIRLKRIGARELFRITQRLIAILPVPIYVNDRADVAWLAGAAGVHLGASDVIPAAVRRFAGLPFRVGVSVGTPQEAAAVATAPVDYWSIGPFAATDTKADAGAPIGAAGFSALAARAPLTMPVIAIGGIELANVESALRAGARGIAVSRGVFHATDIRAAVQRLRDIVDRWHARERRE